MEAQLKGVEYAQDEEEFLAHGGKAASSQDNSDNGGDCLARLPNLFGARGRTRKCARGLDARRARAPAKTKQASQQTGAEIGRRIKSAESRPRSLFLIQRGLPAASAGATTASVFFTASQMRSENDVLHALIIPQSEACP